ncbi:hypothetical protein CIC12_08770 [Burkholderia sp. SG-MS1]|nr:hypothetical protein [Paraburkholderia sp. SG-MS1]
MRAGRPCAASFTTEQWEDTMPAGMQVWDEQGRLTVNMTTRLARFLGSRYIDGTGGSLMDENLSQGEPFAIFQPDQLFYHISGDAPRPVITISGNTIGWSYGAAVNSYHKPVPGNLFYGVR